MVHELFLTCEMNGNKIETTYNTSRVVESREWMNETQDTIKFDYNPSNIRIY